MKLKTIKQTSKRTDLPVINFGRHGHITFNKALRTEFNVEEGESVDFLQDQENPKDFYLRPTGSETKIRRTSNGAGLGCTSTQVVHAIEKAHGIKAPFRMRVATQPTEGCYYALLLERRWDE